MASINPNLPQIPGATPTRPLSHLSPVKPAPKPEAPPTTGDSIHLQAPQHQDPVNPARSQAWLKKAALGVGGLGLLAAGAVLGGGFSPSIQSATSSAPQAQVQLKQTAKAAPARMLQDQNAPIHLRTARFGVTPTVRSFGNSGVRHEVDKRVEAKEMPGGELTHQIRIDRIHGPDGHVLYSSDEAELGTLDFHDQASVNWKTSSVLKPAGQFGHYVSVSETTVRYTGGDSDAAETRLRTIDLNTRNVVNLSELLNGEDYVRVAKDVQAGLNSLQGANYQVPDMETLDSHMNNSFALNQEKDGSLTLTVAIPSQIESEAGKVAEFVFSIPSSALQR